MRRRCCKKKKSKFGRAAFAERFFLREVIELKRQGLSLSIYSMIGGSADSEAGPVRCFSLMDWLRIIPESLYWLWVQPAACQTILIHFFRARFGSWTNFGENSLGLAFALRFARQFRNEGYDYVHATWATAPGMAASHDRIASPPSPLPSCNRMFVTGAPSCMSRAKLLVCLGGLPFARLDPQLACDRCCNK